MSTKVADLTADELAVMIDELLERKLLQWLGDPDAGLELNPELRDRIQRQRDAHAAGVRGSGLNELSQRLGAT